MPAQLAPQCMARATASLRSFPAVLGWREVQDFQVLVRVEPRPPLRVDAHVNDLARVMGEVLVAIFGFREPLEEESALLRGL